MSGWIAFWQGKCRKDDTLGGMVTTIGVIGTGNMGSALVKGWLQAGDDGLRLLIWDKVQQAARRLLTCESVHLPPSLESLVREADPLVVVVKPQDAPALLRTVRPQLRPGQKLISSMAGVGLADLRALVGDGPLLFRIMPNLAVALGAGVVAVADEAGGPAKDLQEVIDLLAPLGLVVPVPESVFDVVTAVTGAGPAWLALAVEAMEDGAVSAGVPRPLARRLVRRMALQTARVLSRLDDSPERLRSLVEDRAALCRSALEQAEGRGITAAYEAAVAAAAQRGRELAAQAQTIAARPCTVEGEAPGEEDEAPASPGEAPALEDEVPAGHSLSRDREAPRGDDQEG